MKKLLSILAIALCFAACQNDGIKEVSNGDFVDVVLKVDAPELSVTRADGDALAGKNSAYGAIDFMNDEDWAKNDLRYILEVYDENDAGDGEAIYCERLVKCQDKYSPIQFELRLVPNRNYKFVVFADFVAEGSAEADTIDDLYYDTTDLRNITAKTDAEGWNAMNELRDAYFVSKNLLVENSVTQDITLTRPFAKLRVITTDLNYITGYSKPGYVEVEYYNEDVFNSFNAVNGNLNTTTLSGDALKYKYVVKKDAPYTAGHDAEANSQTLFADYVFAKEDSQIPVNFKMTVYEDATKAKKIHEQDFSTQIPVQRNHLTTLIGNMLTTEANVAIYINDNFDEPELTNPTLDTIEKPVVAAEADGNKVTISWAAVEGAAKYYTRIVDAGNTFEETTELSKVYENLAWDTTYKFEVYAVKANGLASEHAFAEATTGEEPIVVLEKLTAPVVNATIEGLTITLDWADVEGAAKYVVTVGGATEEATTSEYEYTATDYNTEYTFTVKAIAADTTKNADSDEVTVTATSGSESTVEPTDVTIADVLAADDGSFTLKNVTVVGIYSKGALVYDSKDYILVYTGSSVDVVAGDVVTVSGTTSTYAGLKQFGAGTTIEKTGTTTYEAPTPAVYDGAAMDAYLNGIEVKYIQYTGTLSISGSYYNITVDGATTAVGSITNPLDDVKNSLVNGATVTVTGYAIGVNSNKYINTMVSSVEIAPYIKAEGTTVNADETMATIKVTSNVDWAVTCDATWVTDYTTSGSNVDYIEIELEANVVEESRTATFTLTADGVQSVTVTLTQRAKPSGNVETYNDVLKADMFVATNTSYQDFSGVSGTNGAVYAGNNSKTNTSAIQLRSNNSNSGIVTTTSGGKVKKITVVWDSATSSGRELDVYVSNKEFTNATNLYNISGDTIIKAGTITCGSTTELTIDGDYEYVGLRSKSGAMYITSITITYEK